MIRRAFTQTQPVAHASTHAHGPPSTQALGRARRGPPAPPIVGAGGPRCSVARYGPAARLTSRGVICELLGEPVPALAWRARILAPARRWRACAGAARTRHSRSGLPGATSPHGIPSDALLRRRTRLSRFLSLAGSRRKSTASRHPRGAQIPSHVRPSCRAISAVRAPRGSA